jgi:2',3'-cyclic-nucleotide 2'-phosphodiesterase (5'-nucleotidase family)
MNRRRSVLLFLLLSVWLHPAWSEEAVDLAILHQNDTHGVLFPFRGPDGTEVGGVARLATLVAQIRREMEGRVLLLHAGDILSRGGPLTVHYGGEVDLSVMDRMGYDAVTPGNGDFYFGLDNLLGLESLVRLDFVHANATYRQTGAAVFAPYVIREIAGVKVGILGLGAVKEDHPAARPLALVDPVGLAQQYVPRLREDTDLVVVLSHLGLAADSSLALEVPAIDLILGGHSHSLLRAPLRLPRPGGHGEVVVAQAGDLGAYLGRLDVRLEREGGRFRVARIDGRLLPVDATLEEDPQIAALLARYAAPLQEVVCVAEARLPNPPAGESPLGNRVAEVMREELRAEVALLDRGAVRDSLEAGGVSLAAVCGVHPWRNRVLLLSLTGAQLRQVLAGSEVLSAGCRFRRTPQGVEDLQIGSAPVDSARAYLVAAGEYLVWRTPALRGLPADDTGRRLDALLYRHWKRERILR